jgi:hypothetical protein
MNEQTQAPTVQLPAPNRHARRASLAKTSTRKVRKSLALVTRR